MKNETPIASRKSRIFAYIIDYFILNIVVLAPIIMLAVTAGEKENDALMFSTIFGGLILFFLFYAFKEAIKGKSIGKWLLGIAVREQGDHHAIPSISKLVLRNLTQVLGFIEFILLAINKDKQRLGDKLAKTVVVKTKEMSVWKKIVIILSAIILTIAILFFSIFGFLKSSDAYKTAKASILEDEAIIEETGGIEGFGLFPTGSIQITNGYGEAVLTIKVKGKKQNLVIISDLAKEPGEEWYVEKGEFYEDK